MVLVWCRGLHLESWTKWSEFRSCYPGQGEGPSEIYICDFTSVWMSGEVLCAGVCVWVDVCVFARLHMSDDPIPCRDATGHLLWPFLYAQANKQPQTDDTANSPEFTLIPDSTTSQSQRQKTSAVAVLVLQATTYVQKIQKRNWQAIDWHYFISGLLLLIHKQVSC